MNWLAVVSVFPCLGIGLALMRLIRRMSQIRTGLPVTLDWIHELSTERYRPMLRLLDGPDVAFLRTQPGFTPEMAARLRSQRADIFRGYLRCLRTDFGRVSLAIRMVMAQSRDDRPDLAAFLIRHRMAFAVGLAVIRLRLFLYQRGWSRVDGSALVTSFDALRLVLRELLPAAAAVQA